MCIRTRRERRDEVHFEGAGEADRGGEGDVDVAGQDFRDIRARDVHTTGERGLIKTQLLHPPQKRTHEFRPDAVNCGYFIIHIPFTPHILSFSQAGCQL